MIDSGLNILNKIVPSRWKWVLAHDGFKKYFKNTSWMFVAQLMSIFSMFVNIWVARYLGPSEFGLFSYTIAFVGIFSFIANLGIADVVVRELVNNPEKRDKILGTSFRLLLVSSFLAFFVSVLASFIFETNVFSRLLIIIASSSFLFTSFGLINNFFQASVLAKKNSIAQIITTVLGSLFKIWIILSGQGLILFVFAFVLDYILYALIYLINYRRHGLSIFSWVYDKVLFRKIFSASLLLMFSAVAGYLLMKVDQVMIKIYLDDSAVGYYAAAVKMSEAWYFVPAIICASVFPAIINAKKTSILSYRKRLRSLYLLLVSTAVLIGIFITVSASRIINLFYGQEFLSSIPVLQIYVWAGVGMFLITGINKYLLVEDRLKALFIYNLIAVIFNIALNIYLIPKVGLLGAAWATLISYTIWPLLVFVFDRQKVKKT